MSLSVVVVGSWLSGDICWALAVACQWLLLAPGCRATVVVRWLLLSVVVVGSWLSGDSCWALVVACRWLLLVPGCRATVVGRWLLLVGVGCWFVAHDIRGWCPVAKFLNVGYRLTRV